MEPFTIQCATCQSKLRVRDPHLIHHIVKCPKCDSMLQVEPPQRRVEVTKPGQPDIDSMALTKEGMTTSGVVPKKHTTGGASSEVGRHAGADHASSPPNSGPGSGSESEPPHANSLFDSMFDERTGDAATVDHFADDEEFHLAEIEAPPRPPLHDQAVWQASAAPLLPTEEWTSPRAAKSQQYLMIAFLGVSGVAVAGVLFFLFLRWYGSPTSPPLANLPSELTQTDSRPELAAGTGDAAAKRADSMVDARHGDLAGVGDNGADEGDDSVATGADADRDLDNIFDNVDASGTSNEATNNVLNASDGSRTGVLAEGSIGEEPAATTSPNGEAISGSAGLDTEGSVAAGDPQAAPQADTLALPKQLADFAPLISYDLQYVVPDTPVIPSQAPLTAEELGVDPNASAAATSSVDMEQRMALQLPGLIIGSRSLSQAVNLWTHISGVPTVVNFDSLSAAGIDRNSKVRIQQVEPKRISELGAQLAQAIGGELTVQEDRFLSIGASVDAMRRSLPSAIPLSGFVDDENTAQVWLDGMMNELFPVLAGRWELVDFQLQVDKEAATFGGPELQQWFEVMRLFENWRELQGGAKLSGLSPELLSQSLIDPQQLPALDFELSGAFPQSAPVGQALSRTCALAGLECWIDWANVSQTGLSPQSTYVVVTNKRPLRRVLGDYANNYSLAVALLDDHSLWLTSTVAYRKQSRIYVLDSAGKSVEQWQQQLRLLTPIDEAGVGKLAVLPTPDGRYVIVRCCRPSLRF